MYRRGIVAGLAALGVLIGVVMTYMRRIAPNWLEVVRLRVALPALPSAWVGVRIAHLSDFHAGGAIRLDLLRRAKAIALADQPDIVALTGDFYDEGRPSDVGDLFSSWPAGLPVFAVLGNHDHRATDEDRERLAQAFETAGVDLLDNRAVELNLRGRPAWIAGVDDPYSWMMDESRVFGSLPATGEALLYLAHSPVAASSLPVGRAQLMLCGHTHGGQVRLAPNGRVPFISFARRMRGNPPRPDPEVHRGVHWLRGAVVVISNGLGVSKLPWRFRTRPQVILIELERAADDGPACDDVSRYVRRLNPDPAWTRWLS